MLKIKTFLFALLGVSPLILLSWQLPNEATVLSTKKDVSETPSGYGNPIAQASPASTFNPAPSKGPAGCLSGCGTNGSGGTVFTIPPVIIQLGVPNTPNITILPTGSLFIPPPIQIRVNRTAINIINVSNTLGGNIPRIIQIFLGNPGGVTNIQNINIRLVNIGIPQRFAGRFSKSLLALFRRGKIASLESLPVAQLPQEALLANTKELKPGFTLAQEADSQKDIEVDVNQLNEAISAYNEIIRESSPVALQELVQNEEFVAIGKALKELRAAIN
jgi:hypothetical protein